MTASVEGIIPRTAIPAAPMWYATTRWRSLRAVLADAKPWQTVLVAWDTGMPVVCGDPVSRHWTRRGARRAAEWSNLYTLLPMGVATRLRYMPLPTRAPSIV